MTTTGNQPRTRSRPGAGRRKAQRRSAAPSPTYRHAIVALIRGWVRGSRVANPNQVAAALNRRGLPRLSGKAGWQGDAVVEILRDAAPNLLVKLECPQRRYLTVAELACKLGVDRKQIYYLVKRGILGCRRFGRKIVFPPEAVERAVRACENLRQINMMK